MKFAIITDIHLGPEGFHKGILRKVNKDVKIFLADFVKEMNKNIKPESDDKINFYISDEQKNWLKNDLDKTDKKCIAFVHYSLADQDLTGNPWFEGKPNKCLIANRKEIRDILSASNKIIAVFNSHLHWDRKNVHENIPYFTIQSLIENEDDKGIASETHAVVNIINDKVDVEIKGNYSKKFLYKICR